VNVGNEVQQRGGTRRNVRVTTFKKNPATKSVGTRGFNHQSLPCEIKKRGLNPTLPLSKRKGSRGRLKQKWRGAKGKQTDRLKDRDKMGGGKKATPTEGKASVTEVKGRKKRRIPFSSSHTPKGGAFF